MQAMRCSCMAASIVLVSLLFFWLALLGAGLLKGYCDVALGMTDFQQMMRPVFTVLHVFAFAGLGVLVGLAIVAWHYLRGLRNFSG